mmetsp:Transcript_110803/g.220386  ORF Transcript_110803/g.220386 Transcript_110803/m.220386 type:complete len:242 (-) Transcript_110803:212-937(-)
MASDSRPQLMYFDVPGRVAGLRILMFTVFGKDGWEDRRVAFKEWPELKATLGLQYLPLLSIPGSPPVKVHSAEAMMRWAGKQAGLYPTDADAALLADEMMTTVYEALSKAPRPSSIVTADMLPQLWKDFTEDPPPAEGQKAKKAPMSLYFSYIQDRIKGPFFAGADLSVADLALYMLVNYFVKGEIPHISAEYVPSTFPAIKDHHTAVKEHPLVKAYDAAYADSSSAVHEVKEFESSSAQK